MKTRDRHLYKLADATVPAGVVGCRPEEDVTLLLSAAKKDGFGKNWNQILNRCARLVLTPRYGGKRIRNIQQKLGLLSATDSNGK